MRVLAPVLAFAAALLLGGCAGPPKAVSEETRAAVAPTGKLRVAFLSFPIYATKDPASGELKGVAVDLGKELARRVGVPFEAVVYATSPALNEGAKSGQWDVAFANIDAGRKSVMDMTTAYMEVEQGYLVRAGLSINHASQVDAVGIRVGVLDKSSADLQLSKVFKHATLQRASSPQNLFAMIGSGRADVIATGKTGLYGVAASQPGSRVLEGRFDMTPIGMGVPKGRPGAAAAFVDQFNEQAKAAGLVKAAMERAGLRGVVVAPPK